MSRKAYLASIVPVIVNAILNEHQIIVDIVAFVNKGDFPRSRLSEKQRGKILAGWVTRKMRTIAQFNIRDDADLEPGLDPHRASVGSLKSAGGAQAAGASSLRNMENAPQILEQEELGHQMDRMATLPEGYATNYDRGGQSSTPSEYDHYYSGGGGSGDGASLSNASRNQFSNTPQIRLPSSGGGGGVDSMYGDDNRGSWGGSPAQQGYGQQQQQYEADPDEEEWTREAIAHMNLAAGGGGQHPRAD